LKAIQHLKEKGELEFTPRDIGKLIKEIQDDITEEEKENILNFLWNEFGKELLRNAVKGFPEFYKRYLAERNFNKS
jgi:ATP-dependent helicase/DNAse subunit B